MTYNSKSIIKDFNGKPVPQYWNKETQQFEVIESKDGMLRVIMVDSEGREIQTQNLVDQISSKLDEKLIDAYVVLVLAERKTIEEVPEKYREEVEIRKAERTIEVLGGDK